MKILRFFLPLIAVISLMACAAPPATGSPDGPSPDGPPAQPTPGGGVVYIDSADLLIMESYPVQVALHITGNLPTPCHEFRSAVALPDEENRIAVTVWSEADPAAMCAQVLEPFDESVSIPMDGAADGTYTVWLNGELVGEFNYPG